MKLPDKRAVLANGLTTEPTEVPYGHWHYHILKHPLGIHRKLLSDGRSAPWNIEGWTETVPPVITADTRDEVLAAIGAIAVAGERCDIPEVHGKRLPKRKAGRYACETCPEPVAARCGEVLHERHAVGPRYAAVAQACLDALADAVVLDKWRVVEACNACQFQDSGIALHELVVLSVGMSREEDPVPIARVNRGDGVRAEFYRDGSWLRWRTTYRETGLRVGTLVSFLTQFAVPVRGSLSEVCLVPRLWWGSHGC